MSPLRTRSWNVPHVPIRTNVVARTRESSPSAIAVEGQPIPVDVQEIGTPRYVPVNVTYSRLLATSRESSHRLATRGTLPGSPGSRTYGATSPGASFRWYWTLMRRLVPPEASSPLEPRPGGPAGPGRTARAPERRPRPRGRRRPWAPRGGRRGGG